MVWLGSRWSRSLRFALAALYAGVGLVACHPGACWYPRVYPNEPPAEIASLDGRFPKAPIDISFDDLGIPHVYAESQVDLAYAQGFLHGRDRLAQLALRRAFAYGRLTEVAGPDYLDTDRMARFYTLRLDEEMQKIEDKPEVIELLEAHAAGINAGAAEAGQPLELLMAGLTQGVLGGLSFEPWTARDTVAFNRALSSLLVTGFTEELARERIRNRVEEPSALYGELMEPIGSLGAPVVRAEENTGLTNVDPGVPPGASATSAPPPPRPRPPLPEDHPSAAPPPAAFADHLGILKLIRGPLGSNAWAVAPEHTEAGVALLSHDPHLTHDGPSMVYLMHLEAPDLLIAGASMPGVPGVVVGHGRHVAWGVPVSNADVQDLVRIEPYDGRDDLYLLDAEPVPYGHLHQTFKLGSAPDAPVVEEVWRTTAFGPVLPPGFGHLYDQGAVYAMLWTGFVELPEPDGTPPHHEGTLAFWELARAADVTEASLAIDRMVTNSNSFVLASTSGEIAYRTSGAIPLRRSDEPIWLPRDGRSSRAGWAADLPGPLRAQLDQPASGMVVAANQRIVEPGGPRDDVIGQEGNLPYRAARIRERLSDLLAEGPVSADELLALQQDVESIEARQLSPAFAEACGPPVTGHDPDLVSAVCELLESFDGRFTLDSAAAPLFARLERVVRRRVLTAHFGVEVTQQIQGVHFVRFNVHRRILDEHAGVETALFDDPATAVREGLAGFVNVALTEVLDGMVADRDLGPDPTTWRWEAVHTLTLQSPLTGIPVLGQAFREGPRPEPGCGTCIRAEASEASSLDPTEGEVPLNPDTIFAGAVLRMIAEMSDPPRVRYIIDGGQSGHFGNAHFYDQYPLWSAGEPVEIVRPRSEIEDAAEQRVRLLAP